MKNKNIMIGVGVIVASVIFYGGMKYAQANAATSGVRTAFGQNAQARGMGQTGLRQAAGGVRGGLIAGDIISKDGTGITIKLRDGGSKIVFTATSTKVLKSVEGAPEDLSVGAMVTVEGTANADGSVTAQAIQIRPTVQNGQPRK